MTPQGWLESVKDKRAELNAALATQPIDMNLIQRLQQELDELSDGAAVAFRPKPIKRRVK